MDFNRLFWCMKCTCVVVLFFFSGRGRHTSCALVTGVQTCALPIYEELCRSSLVALARPHDGLAVRDGSPAAHARRGDAASARRRDRHGGGHPANPREEGAIL